jgi:hypothetical protein
MGRRLRQQQGARDRGNLRATAWFTRKASPTAVIFSKLLNWLRSAKVRAVALSFKAAVRISFVIMVLSREQARSGDESLPSGTAYHFAASPNFQWPFSVLAEVELLGQDPALWVDDPAFFVTRELTSPSVLRKD